MKQAVQLLPSLVFDGTCDEAMKFYKSVFGGELVVNYYRDMYEMPENEAHKVMHAELDTEFMTLFAGDTVPGATTTFGDNVRVCLAGSDVAKLGAYFSALACSRTSSVRTGWWPAAHRLPYGQQKPVAVPRAFCLRAGHFGQLDQVAVGVIQHG
jgi:PhnB protein